MDDVKVKIGGDDSGLDRAIASANKKIQSFNDNVQKGIPAIAKFSAASAVAAGGLLAIGEAAASSAAELVTFASISNTTTKEFQRLAAGAKSVHIENDKLADILKDVNDRVGDFMSTGGGPMKDFFEQIAPKVGVTAEQFKNLSGPDALQLYYNSLEKANLQQADMTFYLESMASDATQLIPLLKNNGAEFKALGDRAEEYGHVLSEIDIQALVDSKKSFREIGEEVETLRDLIAVSLKEEIKLFTESIAKATRKISGMVSEFKKVREESKKQKDAEEEINKIIGRRSSRRSRNVSYASAEAAEMDKLTRRQVELERLINEEFKTRGGRMKANAGLRRKSFEEAKNQYKEELEINRARIDQLKQESEAAARVAEIRAGLKQGEQASASPSVDKVAEVGAGAVSLGSNKVEPESETDTSEQDRIAAAVSRYQTEQEIHAEHLQIIQDLNTAFSTGKIEGKSELDAKIELAEKEHQGRLNQLSKEGASFRDDWERKSMKDKSNYIVRHTKDLAALMQSENKKAFQVGKMAAKAQTIMSTYSSAQKAFDALAGIPYVGPALGAAAAAAAILNGKQRLSAISATSYGGGGGASAASAQPMPTSAAAPAQTAGGPAMPSGTMHVTGLTPQIAEIAEGLLEYQKNGGQVVIES